MPMKRRLVKEREHRITPAAVQAYRCDDYLTLHRELGLKLWETSPLWARGDGPAPWEKGSGGAESWDQAVELREQLEEAISRGEHG